MKIHDSAVVNIHRDATFITKERGTHNPVICVIFKFHSYVVIAVPDADDVCIVDIRWEGMNKGVYEQTVGEVLRAPSDSKFYNPNRPVDYSAKVTAEEMEVVKDYARCWFRFINVTKTDQGLDSYVILGILKHTKDSITIRSICKMADETIAGMTNTERKLSYDRLRYVVKDRVKNNYPDIYVED